MSGRIEASVWEERRAWIGKQEASGLSAAQFCRENGLHVARFHSWRHRLAQESAGKSQGVGRRTGGRKTRQAFVQLPSPVATVVSASSASWIEVSSADGVVVRVPASNLTALQAVLSSLNRSSHASRESQHD